MDLLVTYDISTATEEGQTRLLEVGRICERYGVRVQYSVFECRLDEASLERLKNELLDVLDARADTIDIYRLDRRLDEARMSLGCQRRRRVGQTWIFSACPNLR